jgi:hypothetical protein
MRILTVNKQEEKEEEDIDDKSSLLTDYGINFDHEENVNIDTPAADLHSVS